jgi:replicative DNA helicase
MVYGSLFKTLQESPTTPDVGLGIINEIKSRRRALKLSEKAFRVAQGLDTDDTLQDWYDKEYTTDDHQYVDVLDDTVTLDLETLLNDTYALPGLRWRLDCLNKSLGSLRQGDFGFIFARPETGKTTFLASEITNFMAQATAPVIWFNNEEAGQKVVLRIYQAYFGVTAEQLAASFKKYDKAFKEVFAGKFYFFDQSTMDRRYCEKRIEKLQPALVVFDQLTKIKGFKADRPDLVLGEIFQWARDGAKNSHAAIGVSQADGHAENVRYLTMEHVANAKTAMQAEADWILGIGKAHDMEKARFLNISKNKLFGDKDSIPELKHGRFEVLLEPAIARYSDVIKFS